VAGVYSTLPRWMKILFPLTLEGSTLARRRECTRDAHLTYTWEVRLKLTVSVLPTPTSATESELGHEGVSLAERTDMGHRLGIGPDLHTRIFRSQICGAQQRLANSDFISGLESSIPRSTETVYPKRRRNRHCSLYATTVAIWNGRIVCVDSMV